MEHCNRKSLYQTTTTETSLHTEYFSNAITSIGLLIPVILYLSLISQQFSSTYPAVNFSIMMNSTEIMMLDTADIDCWASNGTECYLNVTVNNTQHNLSWYECLMLPYGDTRSCNLSDADLPRYLEPEMNDFTVPIYGYITPVLVFITLFTNILVCLVLFKKNMRSPTNTLLGAMAISDMLTGIWPIPCFIYFYSMGNYQEWVPFSWCYAERLLTEYLPTIFHTASIWLTVALAVQRYIFVCHSIKAKQWCTQNNAIKVIVACYILAIFSQLSRFLESVYIPQKLQSHLNPDVEMEVCTTVYTPFVEKYTDMYFNVYFWFRVVFIHLVPCVTLMVLNALLINAMRAAQRRRELLLRQNRKSECRRLKESTLTTLMLVAVVGLFLLVEFPQAIFITITIVENNFEIQILEEDTGGIAALFINFFILLSYPVNFFIYCGMSRQFRDTFKKLFSPEVTSRDKEQSQYMSLAVENGNGNGTVCKTAETAI